MMRPTLSLLRVALCLSPLVGLTGCYSMYGSPYNSPYGYQQAPAYGAPVQTLQPGMQPYTPGVMQGPVLPNTYSNPSTLQPMPDANRAPTFVPGNNGGGAGGVPNPYMPSTQLNKMGNPVAQLNPIVPVHNEQPVPFQPVQTVRPVERVVAQPLNANNPAAMPNLMPAGAQAPIPKLEEPAAFMQPLKNPVQPPASSPYPGGELPSL